MASSPEARRLTETHRLAQARLGARTAQQMTGLWALLDGEDLGGSVDRWLRATVPVVQAQRSASATLAANYVRLFRRLEISPGVADITPVLRDAVPSTEVVASLTATGPATVKANMARVPDVDRAMDLGQSTSARAAMRITLNGGRETVHDTAREDSQSIGWMRVTSGNPCSWCAMIASRGAVFWTSESAGDRPGHVSGHDGCSCSIEPAFRESAPPPSSQRWRDLWDESTAGLGGDEARNAFRTALAESTA